MRLKILIGSRKRRINYWQIAVRGVGNTNNRRADKFNQLADSATSKINIVKYGYQGEINGMFRNRLFYLSVLEQYYIICLSMELTIL
jgi:hypothetical protein